MPINITIFNHNTQISRLLDTLKYVLHCKITFISRKLRCNQLNCCYKLVARRKFQRHVKLNNDLLLTQWATGGVESGLLRIKMQACGESPVGKSIKAILFIFFKCLWIMTITQPAVLKERLQFNGSAQEKWLCAINFVFTLILLSGQSCWNCYT